MTRPSAEIRQEVGHPIIDADGHMLEVVDALHPYLREALGPARFEQWRRRGSLATGAGGHVKYEATAQRTTRVETAVI